MEEDNLFVDGVQPCWGYYLDEGLFWGGVALIGVVPWRSVALMLNFPEGVMMPWWGGALKECNPEGMLSWRSVLLMKFSPEGVLPWRSVALKSVALKECYPEGVLSWKETNVKYSRHIRPNSSSLWNFPITRFTIKNEVLIDSDPTQMGRS